MTDQQFATGAAACNGTATVFSQDAYIDAPQMSRVYMRNGACGAFSAVWLRNRVLMSKQLQLPSKDQQADDVSWLAEQRHKGAESTELYLRGNGLVQDGAIRFPQLELAKAMFFVQAKRSFYLLGAVAAGGGDGHGIAFDTKNGYALFDPNYGTVDFPSFGDLLRFTNALWAKEYSDLDGGAFVARYR